MSLFFVKFGVLLAGMSFTGLPLPSSFSDQGPATIQQSSIQHHSGNIQTEMMKFGNNVLKSVLLGVRIKSTVHSEPIDRSDESQFDQITTGSTNAGVFNSVAIAFSGISSRKKWLKV